jgi:hypothetical protein
MSSSVPPWLHLADGVARDLEPQHHVVAERLAHVVCVHLEQGLYFGPPTVTRTWSIGAGRS